MRRSRRECIFVSDHTIYSRKLSNGELDQIERHAITLEKATRPKGCKNGVLGQCALDALRILRCRFYRMADGLCCPSVGKLQKAMEEDGFRWSRSSIFAALGRLELTGVLRRTRRHKRAWVTISGLLRQTTVQRSNLYAFSRPNAAAHLVPRPRKLLPAGERVASFLSNLGRRMSMGGAESKPRTGPQGNLFSSSSGAFGEGFSGGVCAQN
jgi:hypothetical protein